MIWWQKNKRTNMKKNLFLPIVTFVLAIGSAFASLYAPADIYVHGQFGGVASTIECINTEVACEATGAFNCIVVVPLSNATVQTAASTLSTAHTYQPGCIAILKSSNEFPQYSQLSGADRPNRLTP
jgi:hypothetical protein